MKPLVPYVPVQACGCFLDTYLFLQHRCHIFRDTIVNTDVVLVAGGGEEQVLAGAVTARTQARG